MLERQLSLQLAGQTAPDTWRYELMDASSDRIRAIVAHPDVADTHFVDRAAYTVTRDAPSGERRPGPAGAWSPVVAFSLADYGPLVFVLVAVAVTERAAKPTLPR